MRSKRIEEIEEIEIDLRAVSRWLKEMAIVHEQQPFQPVTIIRIFKSVGELLEKVLPLIQQLKIKEQKDEIK